MSHLVKLFIDNSLPETVPPDHYRRVGFGPGFHGFYDCRPLDHGNGYGRAGNGNFPANVRGRHYRLRQDSVNTYHAFKPLFDKRPMFVAPGFFNDQSKRQGDLYFKKRYQQKTSPVAFQLF